MPAWTAFAAVSVLVVLALLVLARASQSAVTGGSTGHRTDTLGNAPETIDRRSEQPDRVDPIDGSADRRPDQPDRFDPIDGSADR
ncbi:MAG: hypothetical protein ACQETB_05970, partial [Halobacteriota archaeon]